MSAVRGAARAFALACAALLAACATDDHARWLDHAALVIRPSQHQATLAYSFGAELPPAPLGQVARRTVAATIAAAVVRDDPLPQLDTMDLHGGRLSIHAARTRRLNAEWMAPASRPLPLCLECSANNRLGPE